MPTNNFLPFAIGSGANVESQGSYAADALLPIGNQPGVAVSAFNNKAIRQSSVVSSQVAQFVANTTGTDVLDDTNMNKLLAQVFSAFSRKLPVVTQRLSGSGNHNLTYKFQVASANATAGATYSDGTTTFTVSTTISAGLELVATGAAAPIVSGALTKTSGTGDSTITFYAVRAPLYLEAALVGGGGGGGGGGSSASSGSNGGNTTFGTSLLTANGGSGGAGNNTTQIGGLGGSTTVTAGPLTLASLAGAAGGSGGNGSGGAISSGAAGGNGGTTPFGGTGAGGVYGAATGFNATANSGSGGGGGGSNPTGGSGGGGGAGGYILAIINSPSGTYAYSVGSGGTGGSGASLGGNGGSGVVVVKEHYQ